MGIWYNLTASIPDDAVFTGNRKFYYGLCQRAAIMVRRSGDRPCAVVRKADACYILIMIQRLWYLVIPDL